jgi:hypothetical protein
MQVFYILPNICLPYYSSVISTYIRTNGFISTSSFTVLISSPINLVYKFYFHYFCNMNIKLIVKSYASLYYWKHE